MSPTGRYLLAGASSHRGIRFLCCTAGRGRQHFPPQWETPATRAPQLRHPMALHTGTGKRTSQNPAVRETSTTATPSHFPWNAVGEEAPSLHFATLWGLNVSPGALQLEMEPAKHPGSAGASHGSAAAAPSQEKRVAVHSAGVTPQPGICRSHRTDTDSGGNSLRGQQELKASPTLTHRLPRGSTREQQRLLLPHPRGGTRWPHGGEFKFPNSHAVPIPPHPPSARWDAGGDARVGGGHTHTKSTRLP